MAQKVLHKRNNDSYAGMPVLPRADELEVGEIALNYAEGLETLAIKNDGNKIATFPSKDTVDSMINKVADEIYSEIIDDEYVYSTAISVLNDKIENSSSRTMEITWADLVELRDNGELIPSQTYRITDYICTNVDYAPADHQFDIIVIADSENHLNENAHATHHEGDTYFENSNVDAWELKYCIDNDTNKYDWADDVDGKGVIYYMKDEWGNECDYDFKNMLFPLYEILNCDIPEMVGLYAQGDMDGLFGMEIDWDNPVYCYTFTVLDLYNDDGAHDTSVEQGVYGYGYTRGNVVKNFYDSQTSINRNVFFTTTDLIGYDGNIDNSTFVGYARNKIGQNTYQNLLYDGCCDNELEGVDGGSNNNLLYRNCNGNKLFDSYYNIIFDAIDNELRYSLNNFINVSNNNYLYSSENVSLLFDCHDNTFKYSTECVFDSGCCNNTILENTTGVTFGSGCTNNVIGNECNTITFGNSCVNNIIENQVFDVIIGEQCNFNHLFDLCDTITMGDHCTNNKISIGLEITLASWCSCNDFNQCTSIYFNSGCGFSFLTLSTDIRFSSPYMSFITIDTKVSDVELSCSATTSSAHRCQNIKIASGVHGKNANNRLSIVHPTTDDSYLTTYQNTENTIIEVKNII